VSGWLRSRAPLSAGAACVFAACIAGGGCDAQTLDVVRSPGGVYRPDQGCTLTEGSRQCPLPNDEIPGSQLRFESEADSRLMTIRPDSDTFSNVRVTCRRSYCGTGSLGVHANFRWTGSAPDDSERLGTLVYTFDRPIDLMNRTVGFSVYVEEPTTHINAQIGVIHEYWRYIAWMPISSGWHRITGVVSPDNPLTEIDPGVTSIPVTELHIAVYLSVSPTSGGASAWSGEIYLDDVSW
jgi:hypothetical protein